MTRPPVSDVPTPIQLAAREAAERSAREQGLPVKVTDAQVIEQIAALLRDPSEHEQRRAA